MAVRKRAAQTDAEQSAKPVTVDGDLLNVPKDDEQRDSSLNIYQRMLRVMAEIGYVQKRGAAPEAAGGYSFVRHDDVVAALRPRFIANGIYPECTLTEETSERFTVPRGNREQTVFMSRVWAQVSFVNVDRPEERIVARFRGDGLDSSDKAVGKATSYAVKYALLKGLSLETGDDPENDDVTIEAVAPPPVVRSVPAMPAGNGEQMGLDGAKRHLTTLACRFGGLRPEETDSVAALCRELIVGCGQGEEWAEASAANDEHRKIESLRAVGRYVSSAMAGGTTIETWRMTRMAARRASGEQMETDHLLSDPAEV